MCRTHEFVQPRFDKQVSAWTRSINPTPSVEAGCPRRAVGEISLLNGVFVSVLRRFFFSASPYTSRERGTAFHPQCVSECFPSGRGAEAALCPLTEPPVISSHLLSALFFF